MNEAQLREIYNALPQASGKRAPIDYFLQDPLAAPTKFGVGYGPAIKLALSHILSGLGFGGQASATGKDTVFDQFGSPVESSYRTILDPSGKVKQIRIDPEAEFPPPGLSDEELVQWAADNPPPLDQRLPEKNTTAVEKSDTIMQALGENPPPMPSRKPKKKKQVELLPWLR